MTKHSVFVSRKEEEEIGTTSPWGTWEELVLAFAVNRHGTAAWDSIASELQKRTSNPDLSFTAHSCRLRYANLKRRFAGGGHETDVVEESVPLLEELRKLRVAELRREVERYDLNIESLQSKMKKMEDERERTRKTESDPPVKSEEITPAASPAPDTGWNQLHTGHEPDNDISTNPEPDQTGDQNEIPDRKAPEPKEPKSSAPDPKPPSEDSCNRSSNSSEKKRKRTEKIEPVTDSIGSGDRNKEESDVQSEATKSVKKEDQDGSAKLRRDVASRGACGHVDESAVKEEIESGPLIETLKTLRGHKSGSVFERRLKSQETAKYQKLILQHTDFETIESRIKEGRYSNSTDKFFLDLLLLVNNALVFFAKNSSEAKAAAELRKLISKEMSQKYARSESSSGKRISSQSLSNLKDEESEPSNSRASKQRRSAPLVVCRKRSSSITNNKKEQTNDKRSPSSDEPVITNKRRSDEFSSVLKKSSKKNQSGNKAMESGKHRKGGVSSSQEANSDGNKSNKKNQATAESKKRGAADFLNRMKQGSSPIKGELLDALKNTPLTTSEGGNSSMRGGGAGDKTGQAKEKGSPGKKNIGRPPKRGAAAQPPPPPPKLGKRGRGETETPPPSKQQAKKRSRK